MAEKIKSDSRIIVFLSTVIGALVIAAIITGLLSFSNIENKISSSSYLSSATSPLGNLLSEIGSSKKMINLSARLEPRTGQDIMFSFSAKEPLGELKLKYPGNNNTITLGETVYKSEKNYMLIHNFSGKLHLENYMLSIDGKTKEDIIRNSEILTLGKDKTVKTDNISVQSFRLDDIKRKTFTFENIHGSINIIGQSEDVPIIKKDGSVTFEDFCGYIEYINKTYFIKGTGSINSDTMMTK